MKIFDLTGTVALVTGGNSGIGFGFAEGLAQAGADVAIWGTNPAKNERAVAQLRTHGTRVESWVCDVGDRAAVAATFSEVVASLGSVDSCFANAGISGSSTPFVDLTDEEWRRVIQVNLDGAFYTAQEFCRHAVARDGGGSLVFTTSGSAFFGQQRGQHYGASKAGLISMAKAIAVEHARHGIRANCVLAGWTESDLTEQLFKWEKFASNVGGRIPLRRWGTPDDFNGIAVYFASAASSYHTGDYITIDGGYHSF